jgi:hypothetical protein
MTSLKYLIVAICLTVATQHIAVAQDDLRTQLIGMWDELHPSDNLVYFAKDGSWKLYLKKGEIGDLRSLNGNWILSNNGNLTLTFAIQDQAHIENTKLSFDGEEMVLTDAKGAETRHRRHKGPIPERFQW